MHTDPTVQPSGHASNPDALPGSGSGSASADIASAPNNQRKQAIKYIQPVSASWAQDARKPNPVSDSKRATSETTKRRSGDSGTAHKSSSGEGQVQSVRHRSQSTAHKRPARVDYAAAAAEAAAAATVAAAATAPVVAAPPAAGLHPAQAAMLLSQLQYQQYTAHLTAGAMGYPGTAAPVGVSATGRGANPKRPKQVLGGGSSSTRVSVPAVDAGGVQRRLDDICLQFMQVKDAYLRHAAALMTQAVPEKQPLLRKRKAASEPDAASRAFDKALQIINSSLQGIAGMPAPLAAVPPPPPPPTSKPAAACT